MTAPVQWQPMALEDLARIIRHITEENQIAARVIGRRLLMAADTLTLFPRRCRLGRVPGTRELVTVPPYVIVYQVSDADTVNIIRVWHAAQNREEG